MTKEVITLSNVAEQPLFANADVRTAWSAFVEMRRKMGRSKPFTDYAERLNMKALHDQCKGDPEMAVQIINRTIQHGWMTFYGLPSPLERGWG